MSKWVDELQVKRNRGQDLTFWQGNDKKRDRL